MLLAYVGAIAGTLLGILGGVFGTWCSITSTQSPRERAFMVKAAVATWLGVGAFVAGLLLLPSPYNHLLWIPYAVVLPLSIAWLNRQQAALRAETAAQRD